MKKYYIHVPGMAYAANFYGASKREAINEFKKWARIERMPRNFAVWEA